MDKPKRPLYQVRASTNVWAPQFSGWWNQTACHRLPPMGGLRWLDSSLSDSCCGVSGTGAGDAGSENGSEGV